MTVSRRVSAVLGFLAATTLAGSSWADGLEPSAALLAGYGMSNEPNILGPGLGVRAGFGFGSGFYLGAILLAHYGSDEDDDPDVRHHSESARVEFGYGFMPGGVELRPTLRVGAARITTARDVDGVFGSPDLGLGFTVLVPLEDVRIGLDAEGRFFSRLVDNGDNLFAFSSLALYGTVGYQF